MDAADTLRDLRPIPGADVHVRLDAVMTRLRAAGPLPRGDSPFSDPMLEVGLALQLRRVSREEIERALADAPPRLNETPTTTAIVSAGNIPLLSASDIVWSLLNGDAVAVKASHRERVWTTWFTSAFPGHVAVFDWRSGNEPAERALFDWADRLLVYGRDETVRDVHRRFNGSSFNGFGHRVSVAWVPADGPWSLSEIADRLATDVVLWDQEGCLSPHAVFLEAGVDARALTDHLANAFARLESVLPRGAVPFETRAAVRALTLETEARMLSDDDRITVRQDESSRWTVLVDPSPQGIASPLGRTLRVVPDADLTRVLSSVRGRVQSIGVGTDIPPARIIELARKIGATRVCALGLMQQPTARWFGEEHVAGEAPRLDVDPATHGVWAWLRGEEAPDWFPRRFFDPSA